MKQANPVQVIPVSSKKSNCFVIRNSKTSILIDTGIQGNTGNFLEVFKENHIEPTDISLIILTHTHYDHCGNAAELKALTQSRIMVHASEADNLRRGYSPFPDGTSFLPDLISKISNSLRSGKQQFKPVEPDILIKDRFDLQEFGIDGYVLPTPGHTPGSLCIVLKEEIVFTGDSMFNILPGSVYPPFANDKEMLKRSWFKLMDSGASFFYPAHGKPFDLEKLKRSLKKL